MKKCTFCAEEIQDEAIKCKHCGEFLDGSSHLRRGDAGIKWYFRTSFIIFAVCSVGPFALPLIWLRPDISRGWKIGLTGAVVVLSWLLFQLTLVSIQNITGLYKQLNAL